MLTRLQMIKIHPGERPTVEELKIYPWFDGINWDEVTYGPSARRKCIHPTIATIAVLIIVLVYRQLQAAPRTNQSALLPGLLYILRDPLRAAEDPEGGGKH